MEALSDRSKSNDRHQLILAARVTAISPGMVAPCKHAPAMCCFMLFQGMHSFLARIAGKSCSSKMELLHVQICPPAKETDFSKVRFGDESKAAKVAAGCRELTGGY